MACRLRIADPASADAYPIVTFSWILCYRVYEDPEKLASLKKVLRFGLQEGQDASSELGYVPLPEPIVTSSLTLLDEITLPQNADASTEVTSKPEAPSSSLLPPDDVISDEVENGAVSGPPEVAAEPDNPTSELLPADEINSDESADGEATDSTEATRDSQEDDTAVDEVAKEDSEANANDLEEPAVEETENEVDSTRPVEEQNPTNTDSSVLPPDSSPPDEAP